ncbi:MAG: DUF3794 domain-containing protein [Lachnospiraceae bacterium]|nr:DUF3794 domain-containing protein [Lachnospiraceae bacterium]
MELKKENIHRMSGTVQSACQTVSFTLDDDFNVPDARPDVKMILREKGRIRVLEKKCNGGRLHIRGVLQADVLYIGEEGAGIYGMESELPFDEMIHMEQEDCSGITIRAELEDMTATMIHSRKLNVKALITVKAFCEEIEDEIVVTEAEGKGLFARAKDVNFTNLAAMRKDTIRIREEVTLPSSRPNIGEILYKELHLTVNESRVLEDELSVKGNMNVFLVYRGMGLKETPEFFETRLPFTGRFDLSGAMPSMIEDITPAVLQKNINIRPDEDGEERVIEVEAVLELDMKLYEEKELMVLEDIYSVAGHVNLQGRRELIPHLLMKNQSMGSFFGTYELPAREVTPMQISYGSCEVHPEKIGMEENKLSVEGMLEFKVLMVTGSDEQPYLGVKFYAPFRQEIEAKGINEECTYHVMPVVTDSSFQLYRSNELEWKAEVNFQTIMFCNTPEYMVTGAEFVPFTEEELAGRHSMIGYRSEAGDNLWSVGKRFHVSPEMVAQQNNLEEEMIPAGKMLLLICNGNN